MTLVSVPRRRRRKEAPAPSNATPLPRVGSHEQLRPRRSERDLSTGLLDSGRFGRGSPNLLEARGYSKFADIVHPPGVRFPACDVSPDQQIDALVRFV
jgi:hypothetical protein